MEGRGLVVVFILDGWERKKKGWDCREGGGECMKYALKNPNP